MGINVDMAPKFNKDDWFNTIIVISFLIVIGGGVLLLERDIGERLAVRYEVKADGKQYILHNLLVYSDGIKGTTDKGERVILKNVANLSYSPAVEKE